MKDASQVKDRSLEKLINFFKQEVKGEEMVELERTGFLSPANQKKNETVNKLDNYRTAATLDLFEEAVSKEFHDYHIIATDASNSFTSIAGISSLQSFVYRLHSINSIFTAEALSICP
ncbi:hypothetical protein AVEN_14691-1 [Araneus ventricosus]|uniref:Uncharacterized protein n=1 Tax=Araneus ventricosus TaxID=182803 RepID=A0A4Y2NFH9_ARAVE|nr:hypothetical protein AVEN_14691-1 [Araneus ventricosus]